MKYCRYLFFTLFFYLLSCNIPVDPLHNYDNCDAEFVAVENNDVYVINESVNLSIALSLPHLIDSILFSINETDSLIVCDFETKRDDTIHIPKVFSSPAGLL